MEDDGIDRAPGCPDPGTDRDGAGTVGPRTDRAGATSSGQALRRDRHPNGKEPSPPTRSRSRSCPASPKAGTAADPSAAESAFIPSEDAIQRRSRRWQWIGLGLLAILAVGAVGVMVYWPRLSIKPRPPRQRDAVELVAGDYLDALARQDNEAAGKLSTIEEPPGIGSVRSLGRQRPRDQTLKGSFAPLATFHAKVDSEFTYDKAAGRFTPKNAMGLAGETLDKLHEAKEEAKKSGMYEKMQSGDPNDIFDSAEQLGKVFENVSKVLEPKRLLPTYKMLIESAKPPLPQDAKALALAVAESPQQWNALLKRPFWTLKPDGPFVYDQAEVIANVTDRLASLGDPPTRLRLKLVRFRLEGIDTGWKVVSAKRILPGDEKAAPAKTPSPSSSSYSTSPSQPKPQPHHAPWAIALHRNEPAGFGWNSRSENANVDESRSC